ncbi:type II toxin-antitoxin system RelE/ParE family toxin [Prauserella alba]|uniref:Type II toxin-antitoxin system RelE/ParE family toxin n=1 Tax=Prauserella alba TaxID=176898 RepID=A0ABP4FS15_9PSEU|nr:type II toxin-antitoxin system RelE/ParE family toxin [Prauserella alba]MCP2181254.1 proteic killer suppression protein [Prauserella alba]
MIRSFGDKRTEQVWLREHVRTLPPSVQRVAHRKLRQLDVVDRLTELRVPPGNKLEQLKGNRAGTYSIRVDQQWRICFRWTTSGPEEVEIVDYH